MQAVRFIKQAARPAAKVLRPVAVSRAFSSSAATFTRSPVLEFSEEEELFKETVAKFAQEVVLPKSRAMDEAEQMDPEVVQGLFDTGLMGIETPEEYGGAGASFTSAIIAVEELAKVDASTAVLNDVHSTLVNTLVRTYGSDAIKEKYLPKLATKCVGSFCLSESSSGSDAFALKTRAEDKGDHWLINGSKMWITNAGEAEVFLIFANVDPSKGYKGITCFIADKDMGVQIAKKEKKLGIRASSTCVLSFDDLQIPKENVLGEVGTGYKIAINCLNEGRIGIASQMIGIAQGAFDRATDYAFKDRKQFGKYIGEFQGMQFQIAQAAIQIEAARLMVYNTARMKEAGQPFVTQAAMCKYYASEVANQVAGKAVEWMGGVGFTREEPLEKFMRDAKIGQIYEGTSNIQLQTIAKDIMKSKS
ncbi:hypothetical protein CANCADRAFT_1295 [Tortispora caseinolytica NRRL Y-17796]|uniref:Short/branched chain specific acyl-CoA dehydrogenase, mitochondrial n=1 Tax=Tortispora caseinolytica NRRL Y-17796 TaxID=767744 RepID=A0A1E4TLQ9_9ASCO|nr:hypothetical protein CANCADRAFT_1295 [Tortispora caseinolytica NRRL Y-17796]